MRRCALLAVFLGKIPRGYAAPLPGPLPQGEKEARHYAGLRIVRAIWSLNGQNLHIEDKVTARERMGKVHRHFSGRNAQDASWYFPVIRCLKSQ